MKKLINRITNTINTHPVLLAFLPVYVGIVLIILLTLFFFYAIIIIKVKSYEPDLINFRPQEFEYKLDGQIYYSVDNNLYYSNSGEISKSNPIIWSGTFSGLQEVSPNSRYISLIDTNQNLFIIRNDGNLIAEFPHFSYTEFDDSIKTGDFRGNSIYWSSNSENLYFMKFSEYYSLFSDSNRMELYKYSTVNKKLTLVHKLKERFWDMYYLSPDEKYLYYETYDKRIDVNYFLKVNLKNDSIVFRYIDSNNNYLKLNPEELFISYNIDNFEQISFTKNKIIVSIPDSSDKELIYLISQNSYKLLFEGIHGWHEYKNYHYGYFEGGYFLPGDRYFISKIESKTYTGQLIFDTDTGKYMKIDKNIVFYFYIKSNIEVDTASYRLLPNVKSMHTEGSNLHKELFGN